jgi:hypothetical protein
MHYKFTERAHVVHVPVQDANPAVVSAYQDASGYRQVAAVIGAASQPENATLKVRLMQAKNSAGLDAKALTDEVTYTATGGAAALSGVVESYLNAMDHENGYDHVAVRFVGTETAPMAGGCLVFTGGRFQ